MRDYTPEMLCVCAVDGECAVPCPGRTGITTRGTALAWAAIGGWSGSSNTLSTSVILLTGSLPAGLAGRHTRIGIAGA